MTTKEAMDHLAEVLRTDANYRYGWVSNIAMAFVDQFMFGPDRIETEGGIGLIANKAAIRFVEQLSPTKHPSGLDGIVAIAHDCQTVEVNTQ